MRSTFLAAHMAHIGAELACASLLGASLDATARGAGTGAAYGAIVAGSMLALAGFSHLRLIRSHERALREAKDKPKAAQESANAISAAEAITLPAASTSSSNVTDAVDTQALEAALVEIPPEAVATDENLRAASAQSEASDTSQTQVSNTLHVDVPQAPAPNELRVDALQAPAPSALPSGFAYNLDDYDPLTAILESDVPADASGLITLDTDLRSPDETRTAHTLVFATWAEQLEASNDPIDQLKRLVGDIRTREAEADGAQYPSELERFAARMLEEAGLFVNDVVLPRIEAMRLRTSHMVYLRCTDPRLPYAAKLRLIKLEAALNAIRFACASLDGQATQEDAYRLNQGLARSIVAQSPALDEPANLGTGGEVGGEWEVRYGISQAIETLQLPYRLVAHYRTNVADGNVAIEFDMTPADVFPSSAYVEGLGIVPTTGDMRQRAAADYALRVAVLLAASAFRCSERIRHVWVAAVHENGARRTCYCSVDFDRWRFARLDLTDLSDLKETYRSFAPVLRYEDGWLRPVRQGFHLEEERFCPTRRYMPVSLSSRRLKGMVADRLGCDHVSALAIEEADGRAAVAGAIMMRLEPDGEARATQHNVRTILNLAGDDPDPTVRTAAERVVRGLVEGTLSSDAYAVGEEFVRGDALTRASDRAKELLMSQQSDQAHGAIAPLLAQIDERGLYLDSPHIAYRYFNTYIERALYNRACLDAGDYRTVMLVPDAYYEAHLIASITSLMQGQAEEALTHAERLVELAPFDTHSRLQLVKCLEVLDRESEAVNQLKQLLEIAHDPQGVGFAYYRMAFFQWKQGHVEAAQACYQSAMRIMPGAIPFMALELSMLQLQNPKILDEDVDEEQIHRILRSHHIPIAPTEHTSRVFLECAQAATDAEVFPVARNFAHVLSAFVTDDVTAGLIRSLEDAPDH